MATYTVTTTNDSGADATAPGNLAAETADGGGLSLREAVLLANKTNAKDTIEFANSLKGRTIALNGSEIEITKELEIDGDIDGDGKYDVTIDADDQSRVINVSDSNAETTLNA